MALDENPLCAETDAIFRLAGDRLDPEAITTALGLIPDFACAKGDPVYRRDEEHHRRTGVWYISSKGMVESTSVERHIRYLLDLLEPHSDTLLHIMTEQELKADFFCLWVSAEGHGGPMLSPETMRRIAALHAELGFDFYGPDDN